MSKFKIRITFNDGLVLEYIRYYVSDRSASLFAEKKANKIEFKEKRFWSKITVDRLSSK